jgi:hypothetical protein
MVISPFICNAEAPPRLCDPPCSEKQAGIGPISQKPELLTMGRTYNADEVAQEPRRPVAFTDTTVTGSRLARLFPAAAVAFFVLRYRAR